MAGLVREESAALGEGEGGGILSHPQVETGGDTAAPLLQENLPPREEEEEGASAIDGCSSAVTSMLECADDEPSVPIHDPPVDNDQGGGTIMGSVGALDAHQYDDNNVQTQEANLDGQHNNATSNNAQQVECSVSMLDTVDSCVACAVGGMELQTQYEERLLQHAASIDAAVAEHGLSEAEATLVRFSAMEDKQRILVNKQRLHQQQQQQQKDRPSQDIHTVAADGIMSSLLPDVDEFNICGSDMIGGLMGMGDVTAREAATVAVSASAQKKKQQQQKYQSQSPSYHENGSSKNDIAVQLFANQDTNSTDSSSPFPQVSQQQEESTNFCAICFDEPSAALMVPGLLEGGGSPKMGGTAFAYLPCCGSNGREETSSTKICTSCVLLLSSPTSDGMARIGRCPRCRSWISVTTSSTTKIHTQEGEVVGDELYSLVPSIIVEACEHAGHCQICNQVKSHLVDDGGTVCDACYLGRRRPLLYECEQCHGTQRIPHPMYRYQPSVEIFGKTSWACHGACRIFTMWRILPDQVQYIPTGDTPTEWNDDYLEVARQRVMEARRGIAGYRTSNPSEDMIHGSYWSESCTIS